MTNDAGEWQFVSKNDFQSLIAGDLDSTTPEYEALREKGFLRDGLDLEGLAQKVRRKRHNHFVLQLASY